MNIYAKDNLTNFKRIDIHKNNSLIQFGSLLEITQNFGRKKSNLEAENDLENEINRKG